jgi:hypothetical protein
LKRDAIHLRNQLVVVAVNFANRRRRPPKLSSARETHGWRRGGYCFFLQSFGKQAIDLDAIESWQPLPQVAGRSDATFLLEESHLPE